MSLKNLTILVVEVDAEISHQIQTLLNDEVKTLIVTRDTTDSLEQFNAHRPDIVIIDTDHKNMNGLAFAEQIKSVSPMTPVIVLSASNRSCDIQRAVDASIDTYFDKKTQALETLMVSLHTVARQHEQRLKVSQNEKEQLAMIEKSQLDTKSFSISHDENFEDFKASDNAFRVFEIATPTQPSHELFTQYVIPESIELINQSVDSKHDRTYRVTIITAKGNHKYLYVNQTVTEYADGTGNNKLKFNITATDITEQVLAEQKEKELLWLLKSSERLTKSGTYIQLLPNDVIKVDEGFCAIYDLEFSETFHLADIRRYWTEESLARWDNIKFEPDEQYFEGTLISAKGITKHFSHYFVKEYDSKNKLSRLYGTIQDITAKVVAEQKEKENLRIIQKSKVIGKVGSWSFDVNTLLFTFDTYLQHKYGFSNSVVHVNDVISRMLPDYFVQAQKYLEQTLQGHSVESFVYCLDVAGEPAEWVEASWDVELDANGNVIRVIGMDKDITQKVLLEQEKEEQQTLLFQQNRLAQQGEMLQMIGHQWRQPLANLSVNGQVLTKLLRKSDNVPDTVYNKLASMQDTIQYLSKTITDFKEFFAEDKTIYKFTPASIVEDTFKLVEARLKSQNVSIKTHFSDSAFKPITTLKTELHQALLAIVNNAIDAMEERPGEHVLVVTINAHDNANLNIIVEDNAGGIPNDVLPYIFDPYYSTKKERNGTGLGLYMSKMIIENSLGGAIMVANGETGAIFTLSLPTTRKPQDGINTLREDA